MKNVLAEQDAVSTLIFDEVDTGVSGRAAQKVGQKLRSVAAKKQVLCVTHSAQICSVADSHYLVAKHTDKERTVTSVGLLSYEERINETARIIAGIDITDSSLSAAKELIDSNIL